MASIKFGTDGWRAVIAEDFTFANLDRVAQAAADAWAGNPTPGTERKVIIGYDRRFLSDAFGRRVAEVFAGNDFQVVLTLVPTPTPAVSLAVRDARAVAVGNLITQAGAQPGFTHRRFNCAQRASHCVRTGMMINQRCGSVAN